jgi:protoporphyrinogen oxidase
VLEVVAGGETLTPSHVISSLPLRTTVGITEPEAPGAVRDAARGLRYRDFLTVLLVLNEKNIFPDNWIYIHEPDVRVGRIQNFRSWSPWMVPNDTDGSIGLEYFCFEGDDLWTMKDDDLVKLATDELVHIGLARPEMVKGGFAVRVHKAYPIYDAEYGERVATIRGWLETVSNLQQVGRNGLHRYNNSDHSMLTAMRAVDNILLGTHHDIWAVNAESVYHEEHQEPEQPYKNPPSPPAMEQPLASER